VNIENTVQPSVSVDSADTFVSAPELRPTVTARSVPVIVAVDDEMDDIFFLKSIIKRGGTLHRFQHFSNGDAAVAALSALLSGDSQLTFPLVCLLDIKMTGMSGFEVLKWIRSQKRLDALPVIMFSGSDDPRDLENARELGAQSYVKKFPSPEVMKMLLEEAENFASLEPPKKVFLQWHYRFIGSEVQKVASVA
jgi:CheY-like chemotaxis protein